MNRKSIAYLKALGIDVWLPRSTNTLESKRTLPETSDVPQTAPLEQPVNSVHKEVKSKSDSPRVSSETDSKQKSSTRLKIHVEQVGVVAIVYAEPIPLTVRIAKDIAFFVNNYERKNTIEEDWNWPPFGLANEEAMTETTRKGFVVWLAERVQKKRLLLLCRDKTVDQLVKDVECDGGTIELDVQRLKKDGKRKIWDQLESLMT